MGKYNELMEKIELTDESRERILQKVSAGLEAEKPAPRKKGRILRIAIPLASAAAVAAVAILATSPLRRQSQTDSLSSGQDQSVSMASDTYYSPVYVDDAEALREDSGFPIYDLTSLPGLSDVEDNLSQMSEDQSDLLAASNAEEASYCSWGSDAYAFISYNRDGITTDFFVGVRGSDFGIYPDESLSQETITVNDIEVKVWSDSQGYLSLANWEYEGYQYEIQITDSTSGDAMGITQEKMTDLIKQAMSQ